MLIRFGIAVAQRLEFLSNSRGRRNACATESQIWRGPPAFVLCENIARFYKFNQR